MATEICGAKTKRHGGPCERPAGAGTDHVGVGRCSKHGGSSPQAQISGCVELARRDAGAMGIPVDIAPHEAILEAIRIQAGMVRYASDRIEELDEGAYVGAVVTTKTRPLKTDNGAESRSAKGTETMTGEPALHIWIQVRDRALDRLVQYSAVALRAGVEERQVRVAEQMAEQIAGAMKAFAIAMGMNPADPLVRAGMRQGMTVIRGELAA